MLVIVLTRISAAHPWQRRTSRARWPCYRWLFLACDTSLPPAAMLRITRLSTSVSTQRGAAGAPNNVYGSGRVDIFAAVEDAHRRRRPLLLRPPRQRPARLQQHRQRPRRNRRQHRGRANSKAATDAPAQALDRSLPGVPAIGHWFG